MNGQEEEHVVHDMLSFFNKGYTPLKEWKYGDFIVWFSEKTGMSKGRIGNMLKGRNDLKTLYYLKSDMTQANARGVEWAASFNQALKTPVDN